MKRLAAAVRNDVLLQTKYGFYSIYAVITLVYILLLRNLPAYWLDLALPLIIFSDPSFLGFYFIGGLILLEKGENTLEWLISTPLREKEYLYGKMISLTILALAASLAISFFSYGTGFNYPLLVMGVTLTSVFYILVGFVAVARFRTVNEYLLSSIVYMLILNLPLLDFFGLYHSWFFYLFPSQASLLLIRGAFIPVEAWQAAYGLIYLTAWVWLMYRWAHRSFYRFIILREGMS